MKNNVHLQGSGEKIDKIGMSLGNGCIYMIDRTGVIAKEHRFISRRDRNKVVKIYEDEIKNLKGRYRIEVKFGIYE